MSAMLFCDPHPPSFSLSLGVSKAQKPFVLKTLPQLGNFYNAQTLKHK